MIFAFPLARPRRAAVFQLAEAVAVGALRAATRAGLAPRSEEGAQQVSALDRQQAPGYLRPMVEARLREHIEHAAACSRLGIGAAIHHARHTREPQRA